MAKLLKLRRGTTSQHSSFTGAEGELTVDTTKDTAVVHDGSTAGGRPLLREDLDNMPASGVSAGTYGSSTALPVITVDAKGLVTSATTSAIDSTAITNGTSNVSVINDANIQFTRSGTIQAEVDGSGLLFQDGRKARFGASADLEIYHNGTDSYIDDAGTGVLFIRSNDLRLGKYTGELGAQIIADGETRLHYNNAVKLNTKANGVLITGELQSTTLDVNGNGDISGNLSLGGNLTVTGTVNGRDYDNDGAKLDSIESGATGDQTAAEILAAIKTVDGTGSGLDADLLDGESANFYRNASNLNAGTISASLLPPINSVPSGAIFLWSGAQNAIPSGYVLCNGSNSTPDLRDRFVVGAGNSYSVGNTGGSTSVTLGTGNLPGHTHNTGNHSHGVNNHTHSTPNHSHGVNSHSHSTPNHNHNMNSHSHNGSTNNTGAHSHNWTAYNYYTGRANRPEGVTPSYGRVSNSYNVGTNNTGAHSHSFGTSNAASNTNSSGSGNTGNSGANTNNSGGGTTGNAGANTTAVSAGTTGSTGSGQAIENRPPYYALCYIMKS